MQPSAFLQFALLAFWLGACAGLSAADVDATAQHLAATGVALTLTAAPSNSPSVTATISRTPVPSQTSAPSVTTTRMASPITTASAYATVYGTPLNPASLNTPVSLTERADRSDNTTPLLLHNETGQTIWYILYSPIYYEYKFSDSMTILIPQGEYFYRVSIGDSDPIQGSFRIGNQDKHTMIFRNGKVIFQTP